MKLFFTEILKLAYPIYIYIRAKVSKHESKTIFLLYIYIRFYFITFRQPLNKNLLIVCVVLYLNNYYLLLIVITYIYIAGRI